MQACKDEWLIAPLLICCSVVTYSKLIVAAEAFIEFIQDVICVQVLLERGPLFDAPQSLRACDCLR